MPAEKATQEVLSPSAQPSVVGTTGLRDKVPTHEKVAWAAGGASDAIMTTSIGQLALPVYNIGLGLDPKLVSAAVAIPRFFDAFLDPIVGNLSDNTRSKWGRRKPYIFMGGILVTLLYWLTWCPPRTWGTWGIFGYFVVMSSLFFMAYSTYLIPHAALGFELTADVNERTRVMAYRSFLGSIGGLALPYFLLWSKSPMWGGSTVQGIRWVTAIAGIVMMLAILSAAVFCKERASSQNQAKIGILPALKYTLTNRPFVIVLAIIFLVIVACFLSGPFEIYVITYHVAQGNEYSGAKIYGDTGAMYGILGICMTPVISFVATKIGKRNTMLVGESLALIAFVSTLAFYTPRNWWLIMISKVLLNPGLTSVWILGFAMISDVCDVDELKSGLRREGMFGAMYNTIVIKIGISAITFISGFCVAWSGYKSGVAPSVQVVNNIRYMYALVPALLLAIALVLTWYYPLSEKKMLEVRQELAIRRQR
jgi:GPH family glycoside/pentoside/hexuronide:cation symporter